MCACIHTCIQTHPWTCNKYTYAHMHMHAHTHAYTCTYTYKHRFKLIWYQTKNLHVCNVTFHHVFGIIISYILLLPFLRPLFTTNTWFIINQVTIFPQDPQINLIFWVSLQRKFIDRSFEYIINMIIYRRLYRNQSEIKRN